MPNYIIKVEEYYLEFSSVVEAPVTDGMTLDEFKRYYKEKYGTKGIETLHKRLERVHENGTSCYFGCEVEDFTLNSGITKEDILRDYCNPTKN